MSDDEADADAGKRPIDVELSEPIDLVDAPARIDFERTYGQLLDQTQAAIDGLDDDLSGMPLLNAESDIYVPFAERSAELVVLGMDQPNFSVAANTVSDQLYNPTKTDIKETFNIHRDEIMATPDDERVRRPFEERDGRWGWNGKNGFTEWTSFTIEPRSFLEVADDETHIRMLVHPASPAEGSRSITAPMSAFNEPRTFREEVCRGRTLSANVNHQQLGKIKEWVGSGAGNEDVPVRKGVQEIGLFDTEDGPATSEFVTPAGTLGVDLDSDSEATIGWLDDPEHEYVRTGSSLESGCTLGPDVAGDADSRRENARRIVTELPRTRDPERFLPALGWYYATPFASLIREWSGELPILNTTGDTGAGKSATKGYMNRCFGLGGDPFGAKDQTEFTLTRTLAATNALPVWFDEYKPSTWSDHKRNMFHNMIRAATRGSDVQRGNADKSVDTYTLRAPVAVSGEQRIQGPAEQRRCLMTTFRRRTTDDDTDTARAFKRLTGEAHFDADGEHVRPDPADPSAHASEYYRYVVEYAATQDGRSDLRDRWDEADEEVASLLEEARIEGVGSLARKGLQMAVFGFNLYYEFATERLGVDPEELPDSSELEGAIMYSARQHTEETQLSHVDVFCGLLSNAASAGYIKPDTHFKVVNGDRSGPAEIRFNFGKTYPKVVKYARDHYQNDELLDKSDLRGRFAEAAERYTESGEGFVKRHSQNTPPIGRCTGLDPEATEAAVDGFEAGAIIDAWESKVLKTTDPDPDSD